MTFCNKPVKRENVDTDDETVLYFKFSIQRVRSIWYQFDILRVSNFTMEVMLAVSRQNEKVHQMVNACVSHEMRNPINSILAMNILFKDYGGEVKMKLDEVKVFLEENLDQKDALETIKRCISLQEEI